MYITLVQCVKIHHHYLVPHTHTETDREKEADDEEEEETEAERIIVDTTPFL